MTCWHPACVRYHTQAGSQFISFNSFPVPGTGLKPSPSSAIAHCWCRNTPTLQVQATLDRSKISNCCYLAVSRITGFATIPAYKQFLTKYFCYMFLLHESWYMIFTIYIAWQFVLGTYHTLTRAYVRICYRYVHCIKRIHLALRHCMRAYCKHRYIEIDICISAVCMQASFPLWTHI